MSKTTRVPLTALISALNLFPLTGGFGTRKKKHPADGPHCVLLDRHAGRMLQIRRQRAQAFMDRHRGIQRRTVFLQFFSYICLLSNPPRQAGPTKADLGFMAFLFLLSFYPLIMLGMVTADIVQGPIDKVIHVEEKWDPKRGGDMVKTSEGTQYEIADRKIKMREGGTYRVKVLKHSKLILEAKKQR